MAAKKAAVVAAELGPDADLMSILASGNATSRVFTKNSLIDYSYRTGIWLIDYSHGYERCVYDDKDNFIKKEINLGIQAGSINAITGRTQSFKTTIMINIMANMAYAYHGNVHHYDVEKRLVTERVKQLSKLPLNWFDGDPPRYKFESGVIGFDTLQEQIAEMYKIKMRNRKALLRPMGAVDARNNPIFLMPPSVMLIDSLQNVIEKEFSIEDTKSVDGLDDLRSNTQGARNAKTIRGFLCDILPMCAEANIIPFIIAHKTSNMQLQGIGGVRKQFQYGRNDERMSGGSALEHNVSTVSDFTGRTDEKTRFYVETDGFDGNTVLFEPTKSSTNESGNERTGCGYDLIIDKRKNGVDNERSMIPFLLAKGRLSGNKASYKLIDKDGNKVGESLKWKTLHQDLGNSKETTDVFHMICKEELRKLVSPADENVHGTIKVVDL